MNVFTLPILAPILSIAIITLGNGLFTTITTLQLDHLQASVFTIGFISSCYFIGLMLGSYWTQRLITRIGHIRSFSAFAAIMSVCIILQGLLAYPVLWAILRFMCGYALAGLFIVIESWLLSVSDSSVKGRILAFYLFTYYFAQTLSQLLLSVPYPNELTQFAIISALAAMSIIPVSLSRGDAPQADEPKRISVRHLAAQVPLGVMACLVAGMILGVVYTMLPLFLVQIGEVKSHVAYIMAAVVLGGTLSQFPVGKWSDKVDRRQVLFFMVLGTLLMSALIIWHHHNFYLLLLLSFLLGGFSFTIYPLSINHTTDYLSANETVSAIAMLTLVYGVGSAIGPLLVSAAMKVTGPIGLFVVFVGISSILLVYTVWRLIRRKAVAADDKLQYLVASPESAIINEQLAGKDLENKVHEDY